MIVPIMTYERSTLVNSEKYIGLDVHQATISVAVMDSRGKLVMESIALRIAGQAAYFAKNWATERIEFSLSSCKPRSSSSRSRFSYKSFPNTCVSCE